MGLRSWLTPVSNKKDWLKVKKSIMDSPYSNGIHYVIKIEKEGTPFPIGSVVVAWSGDGSSSVKELKPKTWLLDNLTDEYPEYHDEPGGPGKYGTFIESEKEVESTFK